jgi:asparagine synthase (glutamine-hydrolysing)
MPGFREDPSWLSYLDLNTYLPDDLLVKVDRAAMAVSLETRMPMLDHRVVEFAAQIPTSLKLRDDRPKWPLRQVLGHRVPRELTERKKMGFSTPMGRWLRGPLREWAENQLAEERLRREGFFQPDEMRRLWHEHVHGGRERGLMLWAILVFQAWYESF